MDAKQLRELKPMLEQYLGQFDDCFSRSEPCGNLRVYVNGQLSDLPRKSIEPMADRADVPPRTLQQFLSLADWDDAHGPAVDADRGRSTQPPPVDWRVG